MPVDDLLYFLLILSLNISLQQLRLTTLLLHLRKIFYRRMATLTVAQALPSKSLLGLLSPVRHYKQVFTKSCSTDWKPWEDFLSSCSTTVHVTHTTQVTLHPCCKTSHMQKAAACTVHTWWVWCVQYHRRFFCARLEKNCILDSAQIRNRRSAFSEPWTMYWNHFPKYLKAKQTSTKLVNIFRFQCN